MTIERMADFVCKIDEELQNTKTVTEYLDLYTALYSCMALHYRVVRDAPHRALFCDKKDPSSSVLLARMDAIHENVHEKMNHVVESMKEDI